jgi:hypothetical protein
MHVEQLIREWVAGTLAHLVGNQDKRRQVRDLRKPSFCKPTQRIRLVGRHRTATPQDRAGMWSRVPELKSEHAFG